MPCPQSDYIPCNVSQTWPLPISRHITSQKATGKRFYAKSPFYRGRHQTWRVGTGALKSGCLGSLSMSVRSSIFHHSWKLGTTQWAWTDEQINKIRYAHTMKYYSAIKRNGVPIHATKQVNFENWKKPLTKHHIPHDSICVKYPEEADS